MPQLVRPGFIGRLGGLASRVISGGAAAVTYLLNHTFTRANATLNDGDILTEGAGSLTIIDGSTGDMSILSNQLKFQGNPSVTQQVAYSSALTQEAGKKFISGDIVAPSAGTNNPFYMTLAQSTGAAYDGWYLNRQGSGSTDIRIVNGVTSADYTTSGLTFSNGDTRRFSLCTGGFTSGVPSASGSEGVFAFMYDGSNWNLVAVDSAAAGVATKYLGFQASEDGASHHLLGSVYVPTAADTSVFTPTGYALDTFTDTDSTGLSSHTTDSGFVWLNNGTNPDITINSNNLSAAGGSSRYKNYFSFGTSGFISVDYTYTSSAGANEGAVLIRDDGGASWSADNGFDIESDEVNFYIYELNSGAFTQRATVNTGLAVSTKTKVNVRWTTSLIECWQGGANKLSYSSTQHNTNTNVGLRIRNTSVSGGALLDNFYALPLTSTTYDTAFDTSALTAADCDLYQTFEMDDVTLANGDVIYGDADDTGSLSVVEAGTGSAAITSNALVLTGDATITNTGAYSQAFTRTAGMVLKATLNQSSNTTTTSKMGIASAGSIADANRIYRIGNVNGVATWESFNPAGTAADSFTTGLTFSAAAARKVAIVLGGFDSAGVPSASGDYGAFGYYYDGTNWNLVAASPDLNTATLYATWQSSTSAAGTSTWDDILLPDSSTTVESVFTPTGYAADTFTDTNGVLIDAHALDSSGTADWVVLVGGGSTWSATSYQITSNKAAARDFFNGCYIDSGISDFFGMATFATTNNFYHHFIFRITDASNLWLAQHDAGNNKLYEQVAGSYTQRAATAVTHADPATISVRCSGTTIESWYNGGAKASYTSSLYQTNTKHGFGAYANTHHVDNFYLLPLTSATYADLDTF